MERARVKRLMAEYAELYPDEPPAPVDIEGVQARLGVVLPDDLSLIATIFAGEVGGMFINTFVPTAPYNNVGDRTVEFRKSIHLPDPYVVLVELDGSVVVLKTEMDSTIPAQVIWLASHDASRLVNAEPLLDCDRYESFTDFSNSCSSGKGMIAGLCKIVFDLQSWRQNFWISVATAGKTFDQASTDATTQTIRDINAGNLKNTYPPPWENYGGVYRSVRTPNTILETLLH